MEEEQFYTTLKKWWGYDEFRLGQLDVIKNIVSGKDTLALMPTGAGKSLLYQVPAMMLDGVCVVITPLIALMKDQVDALRRKGILASSIHSGMSPRQIDLVLDKCAWGGNKFLYISPERVQSAIFAARFRNMKVSMIAIDEVHCISQWGYDFRPSYLRLSQLREMQPDIPILAVTASATPKVVEDILERLNMQRCKIMRTSFRRSNISFAVREVDDKIQQLLRVIRNVQGCGIVYVRTRNKTVEIAELLRENGCSAEYYHGGMGYLERSTRQELWIKDDVRIMVATNAFGMGIDKPDVRFVVHYDICDSLEAYYQEAGRGGRDGHRAYALLLTNQYDKRKFDRRLELEFPPIEKIKECYDLLFNYLNIGIGDGKYSTISFNIFDFAASIKMFSTAAINMLKILQLNGYLTLTDETDNPARIRFEVRRDDLYKIRIEREDLDYVIMALLRIYPGIFGENMVSIDTQEIAHYTGYTEERVGELLKTLWQLRIIRYIPGNRSPLLLIHDERIPNKDVFISSESYERRKRVAVERSQSMFMYSDSIGLCRSRIMQEYFGESVEVDCGSCDVCIAHRSSLNKDLDNKIYSALADSSKKLKELLILVGGDGARIIPRVNTLLSEGKLLVDKVGKMSLK